MCKNIHHTLHTIQMPDGCIFLLPSICAQSLVAIHSVSQNTSWWFYLVFQLVGRPSECQNTVQAKTILKQIYSQHWKKGKYKVILFWMISTILNRTRCGAKLIFLGRCSPIISCNPVSSSYDHGSWPLMWNFLSSSGNSYVINNSFNHFLCWTMSFHNNSMHQEKVFQSQPGHVIFFYCSCFLTFLFIQLFLLFINMTKHLVLIHSRKLATSYNYYSSYFIMS